MADENQFLDLMAAAPAPVTVITTNAPDGPVGATVSAFMSLSRTPMLVVVALDKRSRVYPHIKETERYGVNLLAAGQNDLALAFAKSGVDKFAGIDWHLSNGLPRIQDSAGWIACDLHEVVEGGDHYLMIGAVADVHCSSLASMVYGHRLFGRHSEASERFRSPAEANVSALARHRPPLLRGGATINGDGESA